MSNYHKPLAAKLSREEDGQIAVLMIMILPVVFLFFALALDAGIWFFDHRLAQNQADAAALAAVQHLPAVEFSEAHIDAEIAVETWVTKNGSNPGELECGDGGVTPSPEFRDVHPAPSVANPPGGGWPLGLGPGLCPPQVPRHILWASRPEFHLRERRGDGPGGAGLHCGPSNALGRGSSVYRLR